MAAEGERWGLADLTRSARALVAESVTPEEAIAEAAAGKLRPVYLVLGEERLLVDRVVTALREAAGKGGVPGFNEDKFTAGEAQIGAIVGAAKMVPMMAPRRFVLRARPRSLGEEGGRRRGARPTKKGKVEVSPLDELAEYAKDPPSSTVMVLVSPKLHGQRRLVTGAKKGGYLVSCEPLARRAPALDRERGPREGPQGVARGGRSARRDRRAGAGLRRRRGRAALLYVGAKSPITEEAVAAVVTRVRQSSVWELLDVLGPARHRGGARDPGRRVRSARRRPQAARRGGVVGATAREVRVGAARRADPREAAQRAGMPPFKANDAARTVRSVPPGTLPSVAAPPRGRRDLALKGSKRQSQAILETMLIEMCRG